MAGRVSMATKGELLAAIGDRYRASGQSERTKSSTEFVAVTGYHRKHAIRLLRPRPEPLATLPRRVHRHYGDLSPRGVDRAVGSFRPALLEAAEADHPGAATGLGTPRAARDRRDNSCFSAGDQPGNDRPHAFGCSGRRPRRSATSRPASARRSGARCRCARSVTGTIRRSASSRWILSRIPGRRRPVALCTNNGADGRGDQLDRVSATGRAQWRPRHRGARCGDLAVPVPAARRRLRQRWAVHERAGRHLVPAK